MGDAIRALSTELDKEQTESIAQHVDRNSKLIDEIVDRLVHEYCGDLDEYMRQIDTILTKQEHPVTDIQLDDFTLNLPALLYFTSEAQESLGIKEDVSNAIRMDIYNKVREKASGTVADKDAAAELATQAETIVLIAYRRAYKKVKLRVEAAFEMLNSVKKVMSRRIAEYDMTVADRGRTR